MDAMSIEDSIRQAHVRLAAEAALLMTQIALVMNARRPHYESMRLVMSAQLGAGGECTCRRRGDA